MHSIVMLPRSHDDPATWDTLIEKIRSFRLDALQTSPEAFGSTHAREIKFGRDVWESRQRSASATHFLACYTDDDAGKGLEAVENIVKSRWDGMIVLIEKCDDDKVSAKQDPRQTITTAAPAQANFGKKVLHFHLNGMYVTPAARGQELGKRLIETALAHSNDVAKNAGVERLRYTILVDDYNDAARKLYEKSGFVEIASETYEQVGPGGPISGTTRNALLLERYDDV